MQILCDTNITRKLTRPTPNSRVLAWTQAVSRVITNVITLEEIAYGLSAKPNPRIQAWLEEFLITHCSILPITSEVAQIAGQLRGYLRTVGQPRTQADMLIAATAKHHQLTLATRHIRDFESSILLRNSG
jgi:predicted nucleic acid-binding protein